MLTAERLREVLRYDPDAGHFIRIAKTGRKGRIGEFVGCATNAGYITIGIDGRLYYAHQLAWLYVKGEWLPRVDHRDGFGQNNRFKNLRPATPQQNSLNARRASSNSSGFKGVSWHKAAGKWSSYIILDGRKRHLGLYETAEAAHAAYIAAAVAAQPEFARAS